MCHQGSKPEHYVVVASKNLCLLDLRSAWPWATRKLGSWVKVFVFRRPVKVKALRRAET